MYGAERVVATRLGDNARYDKVVEALGGHGEFVTEAGEIFPAIEREGIVPSVQTDTEHPVRTRRRGLTYVFTPKHHGGDQT